jgi:DNA polymerase III epsilon subunit-like protein
MPGKIAKQDLPDLQTLDLNSEDERQKQLAMRYGNPQYIAIDLESTGLDAAECAIVEGAFVPLDVNLKRKEGIESLHFTVRPHDDATVHAKALEINGHDWVQKPDSAEYKKAFTPKQAHRALMDFLTQIYGNPAWICIVGWNPAFDEQFLKHFFARVTGEDFVNVHAGHEAWPFHYHKVDGIGVARFMDATMGKHRKSYRLEHIAQEMFGDIADFAMHTALGDIDMTLRVMDALKQEYREYVLRSAAPSVDVEPTAT